MKSDASELLDLGLRILKDAAAKCYTATVADWPRDFKRLKSRVEDEGISFLTITLSDFGRCFERALAKECVDSTDFAGWRKKGCLPTFLWGFTSLVFEQDGRLKEDPDVAAIEGVRQVAYTFKKILLPCTPARERKAIESYLQVEQDFESFSMPAVFMDTFKRVSSLLWGSVFGGEIDYQMLIPKHGPGATVEGLSSNRKYLLSVWHDRLQPYFPVDCTLLPNAAIPIGNHVKLVQEDQEEPVRVILVPKTLKSPRIIAKEPACNQYTQQALLGHLVECLESHWITSGQINFSDQSVNQRKALESSATGQLATVDLKSASDRVPLSGVSLMLNVNPDLLDGLIASRSARACLPDGQCIPLRKFASMGSATCFPIQAMYYFTAILSGLVEESGRPLTLRLLYDLSRNVYVYGDDLIFPVAAVDVALTALAATNCRVGADKSFWTGKFRESCGVEAFNGEDVTPTYLRTLGPQSKRDAKEVLSWVATSNLFYKRGYWLTADYMVKRVESVVGKLPLVLDNAPGLGWVNYQQGYSVHRWNTRLQRPEIRTLVSSPVYMKDPLDGYPALMKCLLSLTKRGDELSDAPSVTKASGDLVNDTARWRSTADLISARERDHLHRSARHLAVSTKKRWTTPF